MSKYTRKKRTKRVCRAHDRQFRQALKIRYDDELELVQRLYPVFASETYLRLYEEQEQLMRKQGYDAVRRSYVHSQARQEIIEKLKTDPQRYG